MHINWCTAYGAYLCLSLSVCVFSCWSSDIFPKEWGVVLVLLFVDVYVLENVFVNCMHTRAFVYMGD